MKKYSIVQLVKLHHKMNQTLKNYFGKTGKIISEQLPNEKVLVDFTGSVNPSDVSATKSWWINIKYLKVIT